MQHLELLQVLDVGCLTIKPESRQSSCEELIQGLNRENSSVSGNSLTNESLENVRKCSMGMVIIKFQLLEKGIVKQLWNRSNKWKECGLESWRRFNKRSTGFFN